MAGGEMLVTCNGGVPSVDKAKRVLGYEATLQGAVAKGIL
jgi:hypothetical protein